MGCIALELAGFWVELGFSVSMVAFSRLMNINVPGGWKFSDEPIRQRQLYSFLLKRSTR